MLKRVIAVYFSPTKTTEKTVKAIGKEIADKLCLKYEEYDFTPLFARKNPIVFSKEDIVVFGTPVIAGRVPNLLLKFLATIEGNGAIGVPIVSYGNRNYDDALIELRDILIDSGMIVISAGAFVGEHSFSKILGKGRPDEEDIMLARKLGRETADKIEKLKEKVSDVKPIEVKGTPKPYRGYYQPRDRFENPIDIRKVKPKTNDNCDDCKLCAEICPLGSIDFEDVRNVSGICMKCCACIKRCPKNAKYFDDEGYIYHKEELEEIYKRRAKSEIFI